METLSNESLKSLRPPQKKGHVLIWILVIFNILLLAAGAWLGWQWYTLTQQKQALETANSSLLAEMAELKLKTAAAPEEAAPASPACDGSVADSLKTAIRTAVDSHNYAPLEAHMTNPVTVILAASEGVGPRTPAQAVSDLAYLNNGTSPWDFNLPAATLASLDAGFYTAYFDSNTYVGKANDGVVGAFDFDNCGKINQIFMSADISLLL